MDGRGLPGFLDAGCLKGIVFPPIKWVEEIAGTVSIDLNDILFLHYRLRRNGWIDR